MDDQASPPRRTDARQSRGPATDSMRSSSDEIAATLAERILSGDLAPGDGLASERQLALEFHASRPMVREALRSLVARGLIDVQPGRGTFVRADGGPRRLEPLDLEYRRLGTTARQLSQARLMLETEAARLATEAATDDDIARLGAALERLEASGSPLERVRNDLAFHAALVAGSHNPVIETWFVSIEGLTVELMVRSASDPEIVKRSAPYHRVAFEAIRDRDADAAQAAIRAHLSVSGPLYGDDYDRSLNTTAARALRLIGSGGGVEEFLRAVLPPEPGPPGR